MAEVCAASAVHGGRRIRKGAIGTRHLPHSLATATSRGSFARHFQLCGCYLRAARHFE